MVSTQFQYLESYKDFFNRFADNSVDFIFMDPPYEVLTGHAIEQAVDKEFVFKEAHRVLKPSGFIVFTGQEPTILEWHIEARKRFKYSDKIIWSKRIITSPYLRLQRTYEEVCIYYKHAGKQPDYYEKLERYEDLKEGALHLGLYELSTVKTTISDLQRRLNDPDYNALYYKNIDISSDEKLDYLKVAKNNDLQHAKTNPSTAKNKDAEMVSRMQKQKNLKDESAKLHDSTVRNDSMFADRYTNSKSFRYRSKWYCNLTNSWALPPELGTLEHTLLQRGTDPKSIQTALAELLSALPEECGLESTIWSYLPENQTKMGKNGINIKHPTVKPRRLIKRIIQLCCPPAADDYTPTVLDPFGGSGTTPVVCAELGLNGFSCDIYENYCNIANKRIELIKSGQDGAGVDFSNEGIKKNTETESNQLTIF